MALAAAEGPAFHDATDMSAGFALLYLYIFIQKEAQNEKHEYLFVLREPCGRSRTQLIT